MSTHLFHSIRQKVLSDDHPVTPTKIVSAARAHGGVVGAGDAIGLAARLYADMYGLGALDDLIHDPRVTDVHVNGPADVWVDYGQGLRRAAVTFEGEEQLRALAVRLLASVGKSLDDSHPCLDAQLPGGLRMHAVLPPLSPTGTLLSLRKAHSTAMTVEHLQEAGTVCERGAALLRALMSSRINFLITGATGSGKTSLLTTLLGLCPDDRLVLVEDTAELNPQHEHVVRLQSRPPNMEGHGGVGLDRLIVEALRMNPGRLIVGECRGAEVRELFTALNTGHAGGGTLHANSALDVPARLHALGSLAGWDRVSVSYQAASAIKVVLHMAHVENRRCLSSVATLRQNAGNLQARLAVACGGGQWQLGPAWPELCASVRCVP